VDADKNQTSTDAIQALLEGDFMGFAALLSKAGYQVDVPATGILQITTRNNQIQSLQRLRLLISVGIHGDETAPIEMLAALLSELAQASHQLSVDLMIVVGNVEAVALGKRYIEADLNRMFNADRGDLQSTREAARADVIMRVCEVFFSQPSAQKWHLDLHAAIKRSRYDTFAIIPDVIQDADKASLIAWLGAAGGAAVVLNNKPAGTFSAYTASHFGATSCTAELGQLAPVGHNDLTAFSATYEALQRLILSANTTPAKLTPPVVFKVKQELIKRSEDFKFTLNAGIENFTDLLPDSVIATDGNVVHRVGKEKEYVIFPNPEVRCGQRAGLTLVRVSAE